MHYVMWWPVTRLWLSGFLISCEITDHQHRILVFRCLLTCSADQRGISDEGRNYNGKLHSRLSHSAEMKDIGYLGQLKFITHRLNGITQLR